jgi:cobalt-precorrin 5A hydrolase
MKTAVIALTRNGSEMAAKIGTKLKAHVYIKEEFIDRVEEIEFFPINESLYSIVRDIFNKYEALVFIMACGIVVRSIAPYIMSKTTDPAIVVLDEKGLNVISLLSGHLGGANSLAIEIADITGGNAVITTATDINEMVSFDVFAKQNDCVIENIECLKYISSQLVNGGKAVLYSSCKIKGNIPDNIIVKQTEEVEPDETCKYSVILTNSAADDVYREKTLLLRPRNLVLGIGCKRDTPGHWIKAAIEDFMKINNKSILSLKCLATIDLKKDEQGILEFCREKGLKLKIIPREDIKGLEENFTCSEFVKQKVGVASVAEPCAVLASDGGKLICGKTVYQGITLALSEENKEYII